jgi:hypothetical protein
MRTRLLSLAALLPLLAGAPAAVAAVAGPAAPTVAASGPCGTQATAPSRAAVVRYLTYPGLLVAAGSWCDESPGLLVMRAAAS